MRRLLLLPLVLLASVLALSGCSGTGAAADGGPIRVVTSTDVWGDVVRQVGGPAVQVDPLISGSRDPHEYQANARDQLAVSRARLVVVNGGGYDDFLSRLLKNAPKGTAVVDAAAASGLDEHPASGEFNEHVWYDFAAVSKVAGVVAAELTAVDPARRSTFTSRLTAFRSELTGLEGTAADLKRTAAGKGVAITEPVPLYLTASLGLVNRTPPAFSEAVEEGDDVAPAVLRQQLALFSEHRVALLAYNEQTTGATTEQVLAAARTAGVPVVGVRETLPDGQGYVQWMRHDLAAMRKAVGG